MKTISKEIDYYSILLEKSEEYLEAYLKARDNYKDALQDADEDSYRSYYARIEYNKAKRDFLRNNIEIRRQGIKLDKILKTSTIWEEIE